MRRWAWALLASAVIVTTAVLGWQRFGAATAADWIATDDPEVLAQGREIYGVHCASCHGAKLEGQPDWTRRLPSGRMPAPPHDASGHTWHHPPRQLFDIVKDGIEKHAPPGYESDMPAFGAALSDGEIRAVLAYIHSTWPDEVKRRYEAVRAREP